MHLHFHFSQIRHDICSFPPTQASGVNCTVMSDVAQLKSRQREVRPLHPEDMMQDEILVRPRKQALLNALNSS